MGMRMRIRTKLLCCGGILLGLSAATAGVTLRALDSRSAESLQINLTGRQRMLSQAIVKDVLLLADTHVPAYEAVLRDSLAENIYLFDRTLRSLRHGGPTLDAQLKPCTLPATRNKTAIKALDQGMALWQEIKPLLDEMTHNDLRPLGNTDERTLAAIKATHADLLKIMNQATTALEATSTHNRLMLSRLQWLSIGSGLVVLMVMGRMLHATVIQPLNRTVGFASGNRSVPLPLDDPNELGVLARALHSMDLSAVHSQTVTALLNATNDHAMLIRHEDWKIVAINERARRFLASRGHAVGQVHTLDVIPPEMLEPYQDGFRQVAQQGKAVRFTTQYENRWLDHWIYPVFGDDQRVTLLACYIRDVTESTQAQEALRQNEERFRLLAENVPGVIYLCRHDSRYTMIYLNDAVEQLTGYAKSELLGDGISFFDLYHPDDAKVIPSIVDRALEADQPFELTYRIRHRDGQWRWVHEVGVGLKHDGRVEYLEGFLSDITQRRHAEDALAASEARFRSYFDLGLIGMAITSPGKGWVEVNDQLCEILGYSREELMRTSWPQLTHPDDIEADLEGLGQMLNGDTDSYASDKRYIRKDGQVINARLSVKCVRKKDDSVDYFAVLIQDITQNKQAEEQLQKTTAQLQAIFQAFPDICFVLDQQGTILDYQADEDSLLYMPPGDCLGKRLQDVVPPHVARLFLSAMRKLAAGTSPVQVEYALALEAGERYFEARLLALVDQRVFVIVRDITQQRDLERALLVATTQEQRRIGQDLHDGLGQELTGIAFLSEMLRKKLAEKSLPESHDAAEIAHLINEAINHTRALVKGLCPTRLDAQGLLFSMKELAEGVRHRHALACRFEASEGILVNDYNVATQIYYIAMEAVHNAVKHSQSQEIVIRLTLEDNRVQLRVEDRGVGIAPNLDWRVGRGLQIMTYRARMIDATLEFLSHPDGGTVVSCSFQQSHATPQPTDRHHHTTSMVNS